MHHSRFAAIVAIALTIAVASAGCASSADYDPQVRRERLLAMYPPGSTTRADVQKKWAPSTPEISAVRPADGWATLDTPRVRERIAASEQRTGKPVHVVDCYLGPDGFHGLCNCWFYFDEADNLVDAEWQHHTD